MARARVSRLSGGPAGRRRARPSVHVLGLGRPGNELMAGSYVAVSRYLACSPPRCKRTPSDASTTESRGSVLITQAKYCESSPRSTGMARNLRFTTNKPRSESLPTALVVFGLHADVAVVIITHIAWSRFIVRLHVRDIVLACAMGYS